MKEFRNRWFLFGSKASNLLMFNLALDRIQSVEPVDVPFIEMCSVFMSYGPGVRIIYPQSAVRFMRDKQKEALDQYEEGQ